MEGFQLGVLEEVLSAVQVELFAGILQNVGEICARSDLQGRSPEVGGDHGDL
jgi:hypothetical protein